MMVRSRFLIFPLMRSICLDSPEFWATSRALKTALPAHSFQSKFAVVANGDGSMLISWYPLNHVHLCYFRANGALLTAFCGGETSSDLPHWLRDLHYCQCSDCRITLIAGALSLSRSSCTGS